MITVYEKMQLESAVEPAPDKLLKDALVFINMYRRFEQLPYPNAFDILCRLVSAGDARHTCDQWKSKKRQFGSFFLNLSNDTRIGFLKLWQIEDPSFDEYLDLKKNNYERYIFAQEPPVLEAMSNLLIFFLNHGIRVKPAGDSPLLLPAHTIPKSDAKCYGDSTNWGKYILGLPWSEQFDVVGAILTHNGKRSQS